MRAYSALSSEQPSGVEQVAEKEHANEIVCISTYLKVLRFVSVWLSEMEAGVSPP